MAGSSRTGERMSNFKIFRLGEEGGEVLANAGILYEMQNQKRNEGCQGHNHEEW